MFEHTSATKIKSFLFCPESFYISDHLKYNVEKYQKQEFFALGTKFHEFVENNGEAEVLNATDAMAKKMYESVKTDLEKYTRNPDSIKEGMLKTVFEVKDLEPYNKNKTKLNKVTVWSVIDNYQILEEDKKVRVVDWKTSKSMWVDESMMKQPRIYAWMLWRQEPDAQSFEVMLYFAKLKAEGKKPYTYPHNGLNKEPKFDKIGIEELKEIDEFMKRVTVEMIEYVNYRESGGEPKILGKKSPLCAYKSCHEKCKLFD